MELEFSLQATLHDEFPIQMWKRRRAGHRHCPTDTPETRFYGTLVQARPRRLCGLTSDSLEIAAALILYKRTRAGNRKPHPNDTPDTLWYDCPGLISEHENII
jgi:hypothetical protein